MGKSFRKLIIIHSVTISFAFFVGCMTLSPTRPNTINRNYFGYEAFAKRNLLVADELGKLPEIQDDLSVDESQAIEKLVKTYDKNPKSFDRTIDQMNQIGIPEVRKYCAPLQALFWLAGNDKLDDLTSLIEKYSLSDLLHKSWGRQPESYKYTLDLSQEKLKGIIDSLSKSERVVYEGNMKPNIINHVMINRYEENPHRFPKESRELIKRSFKVSKNYIRWKDFNIVVDRLNAPELVHYYVKNNFSYTRGPIDGVWENAYSTFHRKNGHCIAYARFGDYCLKKAGYKTFIRSVDFHGQPCCSDHTASGIILNDESYLLVIDSGGYSMSKHENVESLDLQIAHGRRIIDKMWGHKMSVDW